MNTLKQILSYLKPSILSRYIFLHIIPYFLAGVFIFSLINFAQYMIELTDLATKYKTPLFTIFKAAFYLIPFIISFTIPAGVMIGTLIALGHLNAAYEIIAFQANGVSIKKIITPAIFFACLVCIFQLVLFEWILPWGNYHFFHLKQEIVMGNPSQQLNKNYSFNLNNQYIRIHEYKNEKMQKIILIDKDNHKLYFAESGFIAKENIYNTIPLHLEHVYSFPYNNIETQTVNFGFYNNLTLYIKIPSIGSFNSPLELRSLSALYFARKKEEKQNHLLKLKEFQKYLSLKQKLNKAKKTPCSKDCKMHHRKIKRLQLLTEKQKYIWKTPTFNRNYDNTTYLFFQKIAFSFISIILAIVAVPLSLYNNRHGKDISLGVSVMMVSIFNIAVILSDIAYSNNTISPILAAWLPCIIMTVITFITLPLKSVLNYKILTRPKRPKG